MCYSYQSNHTAVASLVILNDWQYQKNNKKVSFSSLIDNVWDSMLALTFITQKLNGFDALYVLVMSRTRFRVNPHSIV